MWGGNPKGISHPGRSPDSCTVNCRPTNAAQLSVTTPWLHCHANRSSGSGLTDAEIAALIGDRTGPAIVAHTYGDVCPTTCWRKRNASG